MIWNVLCFTDMDHHENLMRISLSLNAMLNVIIGSEMFINIRRVTTNLRDDIFKIQCELVNSPLVPCYSGSRAEGLRFKSSDDDWMAIYRYIKVIQTYSYTTIYDSNMTLLLMENEMTKPGFTLLKLIGESKEQVIKWSKEYILNGYYLSCKRWREFHTQPSLSQFTHGPCASGKLGTLEYDIVYCLKCDIWPANAQDCIRRLQQSAWPSHDTIISIVNDGVLFVPIGAKQSVFENTEWRMSFSLAEKKLIHAMNHTQFLCYGLLKIFLKQAIDVNPDVKGLLCSYFLKTALLWEITTSSNKWNPSSLLFCFWNCFRRLLQWVSCSYCPNFFIPQNNMFEGKIEGTNRDKLLEHLKILHYEGYHCLLRCQSLAHAMSLTMMNRNVKIIAGQMENIVIAPVVITESFERIEIQLSKPCKPNIQSILMYRFAYVTSSHQQFLLKTWLHGYLTDYSLSGTNISAEADGESNRSQYNNLTKRMNTVRRSRIDSVTHYLYRAMLCYSSGRYNCALRLVQESKEKTSSPDSLYCHKNPTNKQYIEVGLDHLPIETVMRRHILHTVRIGNDQNIPELYLERLIGNIHTKGRVFIPPLVCAFFLQYLCHRKLGYLTEADHALFELSLLVTHDDAHHIDLHYRAVSWQILGICQQTSGDDQAACRSLMISQRQTLKDLTFKFATCVRLGIILVKHF